MSANATLALALREEPQAVMLTNAQLNVIANTEFVPKSMRGSVPKVLACVARGRAMGIADAVALGGIDIIEGKATLSAELMCAIVRKHGHSIVGEVTAERAVLRGKRADNGDEMTAEFNREMAETAGLLGKANWKKHPDDMMYARAVSKLCRRLFADCFAGGTYAPEDMQPTADETMDGDWAPAEPESRGGTAEEAPDTAKTNAPGSAGVSPWEHLQQRLAEHGIPRDATFQATARRIVPEGTPDEITADQAEQIWQAVRPQEAQETIL